METITRRFRIYIFKAHNYDGYWQRWKITKPLSHCYDWSRGDNVRIVSVINPDRGEVNDYMDYTELRITRNTEDQCIGELFGQISDGLFENVRISKMVEVVDGEEVDIKF